MLKHKKYKGDKFDPHVTFGTQCLEVFIRSYITTSQSSPVDILNNNINAWPKFLKFKYSFMITPSVTDLNMNTPRTEKMKRTSTSKAKTFMREGIENVIV